MTAGLALLPHALLGSLEGRQDVEVAVLRLCHDLGRLAHPRVIGLVRVLGLGGLLADRVQPGILGFGGLRA
eukprot:6779495-Alexandrium_andersonii.AAC.1